MKRIKKFFKILSLFIFCVQATHQGHKIDTNHIFETYSDIWKYCEKWENGDL